MKRPLAWVGLALVVAACGTAGTAGDDDFPYPDGAVSEDGGADSDAAPAIDAPPYGCAVVFRVVPSRPVVGDDVTVTATIERATGPVIRTWTVWDVNHREVEPTVGRDGESVAFRVSAVGNYQVDLGLNTDSGCSGDKHMIGVRAAGAARAQWWLQVVFPERLGLPPHEERVWIESGAPLDVPVDEAMSVDLLVVDAAGAPVPAIVRWSRLPGVRRPYAVPVEAATDDEGRVRARLHDEDDYEVLIVPRCADAATCALAPTAHRSWAIADEDLVVVAGQELTGTVTGPGGGPLAGARVALTIDGVPTTVATSSATGAFAVRASRLGRARVVVAPDGGGLPRLEASLDVAAGQPIAIRYAPLSTRALTGAAVRLGGEPYAGARLTVVADIAAAGTIEQGATSAVATGHFVASQVTGPDRALLPLVAPAVPVSIVLEPQPLQFTVVAVDLAAAAPAAFDAAPQATLRGRVSAPDGGDPGPVWIRARPTGPLAAATGMAPGKLTDPDGAFSLPVAAGGTYELAGSDASERFAESGRVLAVAGTVPDLALRAAIAIDGTVDVDGMDGSALRGAAIALRCLECTGTEVTRAVAVTVVGSDGRFRLMAPDPGVAGAGSAP